MVVILHGLVPVVEYTVYDNIKYRRGDDISLSDAAFCWERCSKETALSWDDGVGIPEGVEYAYSVVSSSIILE